MSAFGGKADIGQSRRRLKIREKEAQAQGLLQLAIDLKLAIMELERLERYQLWVSRGERN